MPIPGSSFSALDLTRAAMLELGVLQSGEQPSNAEAQDVLVRLNQMMDTYNAEGAMIFTTTITDFPLSSNKQIYTLGTGGDFNIPRPAEIDRASIVILSNPTQPLEYPIPIYTTQDWQEKVPVKNVPGNLPLLVYDDGNFPLRSLTFWPVASDSTLFRLYAWQKLTQFADVNQVASFPEGYAEAITYNLAVRIAAMFQATIPISTATLAISTLATVKNQNADDTQLRSDLHSNMTPSRIRTELFNIP